MSTVERIAARVSVGVCLVVGVYIAVELWGGLDDHRHGSLADYILYREAAAHWLATGRFYDYGFWAVGAWGPPIGRPCCTRRSSCTSSYHSRSSRHRCGGRSPLASLAGRLRGCGQPVGRGPSWRLPSCIPGLGA